MEIRVIGSPAELERAAKVIAAAYDIQQQSKPYPCRNSDQQRQYYTVAEKQGNNE